jgi:hypothetical protein
VGDSAGDFNIRILGGGQATFAPAPQQEQRERREQPQEFGVQEADHGICCVKGLAFQSRTNADDRYKPRQLFRNGLHRQPKDAVAPASDPMPERVARGVVGDGKQASSGAIIDRMNRPGTLEMR